MDLAGLAEFPGAPEVPETGATFAENALLKARAIAAFTGLPAVADDSGLCADALNGMPGVLSARWSGRHGDDEAQPAAGAGPAGRRARRAPRRELHLRGRAGAAGRPGARQRGRDARPLVREPRGENGFGYDPIFVAEGMSCTNAELDASAKDAISHRGKALRALAPVIAALLG